MGTLFIFMVLLTLVSSNTETDKNIFLPESMIFSQRDSKGENHFYVRVYQAIEAPVEGTGLESFPLSPKHKDIFSDRHGNIVTVNGQKTHIFWVGVGDYRNQIKFIDRYGVKSESKPMIRSFLVDYDTVRKHLNRNVVLIENDLSILKIKTEESELPSPVPLNVDKKFPNQFGLTEYATEEFRRNALPNSLVTYVHNPK